jgi:hypothetical protein
VKDDGKAEVGSREPVLNRMLWGVSSVEDLLAAPYGIRLGPAGTAGTGFFTVVSGEIPALAESLVRIDGLGPRLDRARVRAIVLRAEETSGPREMRQAIRLCRASLRSRQVDFGVHCKEFQRSTAPPCPASDAAVAYPQVDSAENLFPVVSRKSHRQTEFVPCETRAPATPFFVNLPPGFGVFHHCLATKREERIAWPPVEISRIRLVLGRLPVSRVVVRATNTEPWVVLG